MIFEKIHDWNKKAGQTNIRDRCILIEGRASAKTLRLKGTQCGHSSVWSQVWGITEATGAGEKSWREKQQEEEEIYAKEGSATSHTASIRGKELRSVLFQDWAAWAWPGLGNGAPLGGPWLGETVLDGFLKEIRGTSGIIREMGVTLWVVLLNISDGLTVWTYLEMSNTETSS